MSAFSSPPTLTYTTGHTPGHVATFTRSEHQFVTETVTHTLFYVLKEVQEMIVSTQILLDPMTALASDLTSECYPTLSSLLSTNHGQQASLSLLVAIDCHHNDCSIECVPDLTNHWTCDSDGNRVCINGWTGDLCDICTPSLHCCELVLNISVLVLQLLLAVICKWYLILSITLDRNPPADVTRPRQKGGSMLGGVIPGIIAWVIMTSLLIVGVLYCQNKRQREDCTSHEINVRDAVVTYSPSDVSMNHNETCCHTENISTNYNEAHKFSLKFSSTQNKTDSNNTVCNKADNIIENNKLLLKIFNYK